MKKVARLLAGVSAIVFPASAGAAEEIPLRDADRAAVGVSLGATNVPSTNALAVRQLAPAISAAFRLAPPLVVTADGAFAFSSLRFGDARRTGVLRAGNPLVGARYRVLESAAVALLVGASIGAPLVTVPSGGITSSAAAEQADRSALAAAGPRGAWTWARNAVPVVGLGRVTRWVGPVRVRLDVEPGVLLSVNRDPTRAAVVVTGEAALGLPVVAPYVSASALVATRALDGRDFAQTGIAVGARHELGSFFGAAEARVQLDGPQGVADRYATFFGATLAAGVRL